MLSIFLLLRNLDVWTSTTFKKRVEDGVNAFAEDVSNGVRRYMPWKDCEPRSSRGSSRAATVMTTRSMSAKENKPPESTISESTISSEFKPASRQQRPRAAKSRARPLGPGNGPNRL